MEQSMRKILQPASRAAPLIILCWGSLLLAPSAWGADSCAPAVGELVSVEGQVDVRRADSTGWQRAQLGELLCERDTVRVGAESRGTLALVNDAILRLDQNTTIQLLDITQELGERSFFDLILGALQSFSRSPRTLGV